LRSQKGLGVFIQIGHKTAPPVATKFKCPPVCKVEMSQNCAEALVLGDSGEGHTLILIKDGVRD
jgi:hypothetical protein